MDTFVEQGVIKQKRTLNEIAFILATVLMVLFAVVALWDLNVLLYGFSVIGLLETLSCVGIAVLLFFKRGDLRMEYDYTFTNGILDFARIFNGSRRKELGSLKMKNIDAFGKVNSSSFDRYLHMQNVKTDRWFLNRDAELYYFFFQKNGSKRLIIIEPNDELVEAIVRWLPQGAKQA